MNRLGHSVSNISSFMVGDGVLSVLTYGVDAFIRDELSKGRYDPAISKICFEILLELFGRTLKLDLGAHDGVKQEIEDVC